MEKSREILEKLKNAKTSLKRRYGVTEVALYGSYSTGVEREDSYVELMVNFDKAPDLRFTDLEEELADLLQLKVDVTARKDMEPTFYKSIRKELIYV